MKFPNIKLSKLSKFRIPKLPFKLPFKLPDLKDSLTRRRLLIYFLMAGVALTVFSVSMMGVVNLPEFCTLCHSQRPEYEAWKRSAHANIGCKACHTPPGGAVTLLFDEMVQTWVGMKEFIGYKKPINAHSEYSQKHVPNAVCLRCHSPQTRVFTPRPEVKMGSLAHKKHLEKGVRCTTCHNRVTHQGAERFEPITKWKKNFRYKNFTTMMDGCFRCHRKGRIELTEKRISFVEPRKLEEELHASLKPAETEMEEEANEYVKILFEEEEKAEKEGSKLYSAPRRCDTCHPPDFNLRPKSHRQEGWAPAAISGPVKERTSWAHAKEAKELSPVTCYQCHLKTFCLDCHGTDMPHPPPWRDRHGKGVVASVRPTPEPAFFADQPFALVKLQFAPISVLKDPQTLFCHRCHSSENFCQSCHGVTFPHPSDWRYVHGRIAQAPLQVAATVKLVSRLQGKVGQAACQTCHRPQFCDGCHGGVPMPHPSGWISEHRLFLTDREPKICLRCHEVRGCEQCHSAHNVHNKQSIYDFSTLRP